MYVVIQGSSTLYSLQITISYDASKIQSDLSYLHTVRLVPLFKEDPTRYTNLKFDSLVSYMCWLFWHAGFLLITVDSSPMYHGVNDYNRSVNLVSCVCTSSDFGLHKMHSFYNFFFILMVLIQCTQWYIGYLLVCVAL